MKITQHFSSEEFACRDGTPYPARWIDTRLRPLCEALEVLQAALGKPLRVNSGYRTPDYNARIGGARLSQHVEGRAADIVVDGISPAMLHGFALQLHLNGKLKIGGIGEYPKFTHVDVRPRPTGCGIARWSGSRSSNEA